MSELDTMPDMVSRTCLRVNIDTLGRVGFWHTFMMMTLRWLLSKNPMYGLVVEWYTTGQDVSEMKIGSQRSSYHKIYPKRRPPPAIINTARPKKTRQPEITKG
jgi:hypothetical protein